MFNSTSVLDKGTAVVGETCLHGVTEKLAPPRPLLFRTSNELQVSECVIWQCLYGARKLVKTLN